MYVTPHSALATLAVITTNRAQYRYLDERVTVNIPQLTYQPGYAQKQRLPSTVTTKEMLEFVLFCFKRGIKSQDNPNPQKVSPEQAYELMQKKGTAAGESIYPGVAYMVRSADGLPTFTMDRTFEIGQFKSYFSQDLAKLERLVQNARGRVRVNDNGPNAGAAFSQDWFKNKTVVTLQKDFLVLCNPHVPKNRYPKKPDLVAFLVQHYSLQQHQQQYQLYQQQQQQQPQQQQPQQQQPQQQQPPQQQQQQQQQQDDDIHSVDGGINHGLNAGELGGDMGGGGIRIDIDIENVFGDDDNNNEDSDEELTICSLDLSESSENEDLIDFDEFSGDVIGAVIENN